MNEILTRTNNILIIGKYSKQQFLLTYDLINKITSFNNIKTKVTFTNESEIDIMGILEYKKNNPIPILIYFNDCINFEMSNNSYFKQLILGI